MSPLLQPESFGSVHWFYVKYVRMYTDRNLAKPWHILSALRDLVAI
jgi:hypothetical protein